MRTYDLVGVGLGPFNLGLAALADGLPADVRPDALFLDSSPEFSWHPGLMVEGATLQVPFLADLVSLVDPTSRWSFLAYLRAHDRLFPFYFSERFHVPRREYDHYCRWVAASLPSSRFGAHVEAVRPDGDGFVCTYADVATGRRVDVRARDVVLGLGTEPVVPEPFRALVRSDAAGKRVFPAAAYLDRLPALHDVGDVTVVGSGQSGAEVFCDLLRRQPDTGWRLRWLTRSPAFAPMEYSKLGLEHFTPDYTAYFRALPQHVRDRLVPAQWQLYKGISGDTLAEIHDLLYERSIGGARCDVTLMPHVAVEHASVSEGAHPAITLGCRHREQDRTFETTTGAVVLATGYAPRRPALLDPMAHLVDWDARGRYRVDDDHRVALDPSVRGRIFVQNAEMHTHGVGAPDLGLGAWRSATILNAVTGREVYALPSTTAFTTFGVA